MNGRRARVALTLLGPLAVSACAGAPPEASGPCTDALAFCRQYRATGFFHVESDCGRPLLVDPGGLPFYSFGVNHVNWEGDESPKSGSNPYKEAIRARYGTEEAWADATVTRLRGWGWNTVGAWSSSGSLGARMPYTHMLSLSGANWQTGTIPDYFDPAWEAEVTRKAVAGATGRRDDPRLVGYFIDNEMH